MSLVIRSAKFSYWIILTIVSFNFKFAKVFCAPQYETSYRYCQLPEETFFNGRCLPIGSTEHCPNNMQLYDASNNEGFCDCMDIPSRPAFYSDETGECSFHNTQGPCLSGEWFVLKNGSPQCELVPEGCPADGRHFYGSPNGAMEKQCWEKWTQGPCPPREILEIEEDEEELKIVCRIQLFTASAPFSVGSQASCRPGTLRDRLGQCKRGIIG